jgi:hypothetical protein
MLQRGTGRSFLDHLCKTPNFVSNQFYDSYIQSNAASSSKSNFPFTSLEVKVTLSSFAFEAARGTEELPVGKCVGQEE